MRVFFIMLLIGVYATSTPDCVAQNLKQTDKQKWFPKVGEQFVDHEFYDVINYPKKRVSTKDFLGKWLILDVWGYSCGSCISSFPKMDKLQKQFKDKVTMIMVGATSSGPDMKTPISKVEEISKGIYHRLNKLHKLSIPTAYDSVFYYKYDVGGLPQIFLIDPSGVLRAKAVSIDSAQLAQLMEGKIPDYEVSYSRHESRPSDSYNNTIPFLTSGKKVNGGIDTSFLYRSVLTLSDKITTYKRVDFFYPDEKFNGAGASVRNTGRIEVFNTTLADLYFIAHFGKRHFLDDTSAYSKIWPNVIWEVNRIDTLTTYNYSLSVPKDKATTQFLMKSMQNDLERYFHLHGAIEKRKMPVYVLTISDRRRLDNFINKSRLNNSELRYNSDVIFKGSMGAFSRRLANAAKLKLSVIDRTDIDYNIDVRLSADFYNLNEVIKKLKECGLSLSIGTSEMSVLVLRTQSF